MEHSSLEQILFDKLTGRLPLNVEKEKRKPVSLADEIHALARAGQVMDPVDGFGTVEGYVRNMMVQNRMFHELSSGIFLELLHRLENVEKAIGRTEDAKEEPTK